MVEVTIDQSGKVEIPEAIRKCFSLNTGSKLEITIGKLGEIRLQPLPENGYEADHQEGANEAEPLRLIRKNGVLMVAAGQQGDEYLKYYLLHAVELDREERMRKLMGEITL